MKRSTGKLYSRNEDTEAEETETRWEIEKSLRHGGEEEEYYRENMLYMLRLFRL
jgi:hypothetical protein